MVIVIISAGSSATTDTNPPPTNVDSSFLVTIFKKIQWKQYFFTMKLSFASSLALATSASAFVASPAFNRISSTELYERKPFITGNWKLNPSTKGEAIALAEDIVRAVHDSSPGDVGLFVPFPFIETVQKIVGDKITIGAEVCICIYCIYLNSKEQISSIR